MCSTDEVGESPGEDMCLPQVSRRVSSQAAEQGHRPLRTSCPEWTRFVAKGGYEQAS